MVAQNIAFSIIAAGMAYGAFRVVTSRNVVRAALWLIVVLAGAAAQYILLAAEFVAITQVVIYVGAIIVLFLFGLMLTRAKIGDERELTSRQWPIALLVGLLLLGVMTWALIDRFHADELPKNLAPTSVATVSDSIFSTYLLPFEAISFVLLAALIGAVVLARRD
jgi:NADH-quinone oxidoreductase subunit J